YDGTDTTLPVDFRHGSIAEAKERFEATHKAQFGFAYDDKPLIVETVAVEGSSVAAGRHDEALAPSGPARAAPASEIRQVVIEAGWQAEITGRDHVLLRRVEKKRRHEALGTGLSGKAGADPVMLEVFNNLFMSIAEQMGVTLQNTAYSVNIKERLDFSCAVF